MNNTITEDDNERFRQWTETQKWLKGGKDAQAEVEMDIKENYHNLIRRPKKGFESGTF